MPCPVGCRIQGQRAAGLRPQLRLVDVYDLLPCLGPRETSLGFSFLRFGLTYSLWFGPNPRAYEPPRTGLSPGLPTTAPTQLSYQGLYLRITTIRNSVKTVTKPGSVCVAAKHQSTEVCNRERADAARRGDRRTNRKPTSPKARAWGIYGVRKQRCLRRGAWRKGDWK